MDSYHLGAVPMAFLSRKDEQSVPKHTENGKKNMLTLQRKKHPAAVSVSALVR